MSRNKDPYAEVVYELERTIIDGITFRGLKEIQFYVNQITGSLEWQEAKPTAYRLQLPRVVTVETHKAKTYSVAYHPNRIVLARSHFLQSVVLHELAHLMTPPVLTDHGKEFAHNYLWLAERFWGKSYAEGLRKLFAYYRVPHVCKSVWN